MSAGLARRYAQALLEIGQEQERVRELGGELQTLVQALDEAEELDVALLNPTLDTQAKRGLAEAITEKMELSETTRNFVGLLIQKNRFDQLRTVAEEYARMAHEVTGTVRAQVTTAAELPENMQNQLAEKLSSVTGKKVELDKQVDPDLLGGLIAEVGGVVYDGSLATQLRTLRRNTTR